MMKTIAAVLGGLLIACAVLVGLVSFTSRSSAEPNPAHVAVAETVAAEHAAHAFSKLPRRQRTCETARAAGAAFLAHETAWQIWRRDVLAVYCGGSR